jgi:Na+-transporting methylmalonyl-CoA/oxaloacetate decarboxylase gamma subunit
MILIGLVVFLVLLILIHCAWRCYGNIISLQRPNNANSSANDIYFTPKTNKILARLDNKGKADGKSD